MKFSFVRESGRRRGSIFPIVVLSMSAVMLASVMMMSSLVIRLKAYSNSAMCGMRAYYAAQAGLTTAVQAGELGGYANNCQAGEYLKPYENTCLQPGDDLTISNVDGNCSYSVEYGGVSGGKMSLNAIGRCIKGSECRDGSVIKISALVDYLATPGSECPKTGSQLTIGSNNYTLVWYDTTPNGLEDNGECWLAQNLRESGALTQETDGLVPFDDYVYPMADGSCTGFCQETDSTDLAALGYLYKSSALNNLCPAGWRLPTAADWTAVTNYLGGAAAAGQKLKPAVAETYWTASGYSGHFFGDKFLALGAGNFINGNYNNRNLATDFWADGGTIRSLTNGGADIASNAAASDGFYSVRCVKAY